MVMNTIIDSKGCSFLSQFLEDLPDNCYLNKGLTGVGATTLALLNKKNYVVAVPFISLITNKCSVHKNVCPVYGDIFDIEIEQYLQDTSIQYKKFMVTYDSLARLLQFIDPSEYKILIDEAHKLLDSASFRTNAIETVLENYQKFSSYCFATATPVREQYQLPALRNIPVVSIKWYDIQPISITHFRYEKNLNQIIALLIIEFLNNRYKGNPYFFINSVKSIVSILRYLKTSGYDNPLDYRIICADNETNRNTLDNAGLSKYEILDSTSKNRKITFITSTGFEGSDYFDEDGLTYIVSDGTKEHTVYDILCTIPQIIGRLRNSKYKNDINVIYTPSTYFNYTTIQEYESEVLYQLEKNTSLVKAFKEAEDDLVRNALITGTKLNPYLMVRNGELKLNENAWYSEMNNYAVVNSKYYTKALHNTLINGVPYNFRASDPDITLEGLNKLRLSKKPNFKVLCKQYIKAKGDSNDVIATEIESTYPLIKEAYDQLGADKLKALDFVKKRIENLLNQNTKVIDNEVKIVKLLNLKIGQLVSKAVIKEEIQKIYNLLDIKKTAKATDLKQWYTVKPYDKKIEGKTVSHFKIITCNIKVP